MQLLKYLKDMSVERRRFEMDVEYRLLFSGNLLPADVMGKAETSELGRLLLRRPFVLVTADRPTYASYPQELALRFGVDAIEENEQVGPWPVTLNYYPDEEIANDFSALLTLFSRRLATVATKTREDWSSSSVPREIKGDGLPELDDIPLPVVTRHQAVFWRLDELNVSSDRVFLDARKLQKFLSSIRDLTRAEGFVRAARQYASAVAAVPHEVDTAYQRLATAVETLASTALPKWTPSQEEQLKGQKTFLDAAQARGVSKDIAEQLALEACKVNSWTRRKFVRFVMQNIDRSILSSEDDVFLEAQRWYPPPEDAERCLREIYTARNCGTHSGKEYHRDVRLGLTKQYGHQELTCMLRHRPCFPPFIWFERVVQNAMVCFLEKQSPNAASRPEGE